MHRYFLRWEETLLIFSNAWAVRPYTPIHPDPVLESWRWRSFPELNGLGLRCMAEAKDKAMWFGVDDGVRRYDGMKWSAYTEKDGVYGAQVNALCGTRDGSIYTGTPIGISRFKEGKWSRVFPPEGDLPWTTYKLMEAKDGSVWAGTAWGALHFGHDGPTLYTTEQMGAALKALAPDVRLSIVPEEAAPARSWGNGVGVATTGGMSFLGNLPEVVWALTSGGPGDQAGLKVGDRIVAVDGQTGVNQTLLDGPAGTSVRLTVQVRLSATSLRLRSALSTQNGDFSRRRRVWASGITRISPRPGMAPSGRFPCTLARA